MNNYDKLDYYIDLVTRTYNIFNGQINPINRPAQLIISSLDYETPAHMDRYNVIVHIFALMKYFENYMEMMIVEVVLHELSHFDQIIDYGKYNTDIAYRDAIEAANEMNTLEFMIRNIDYINYSLGINISKPELGNLYTQAIDNYSKMNMPYCRIGYNTLYSDLLMRFEFNTIFKDENITMQNAMDVFSNMNLCIGRSGSPYIKVFNIKSDNMYNIDTQSLNRFMYENFDRWQDVSYVISTQVSQDYNTVDWLVRIESSDSKPIIRKT